MVPGKQLPHAMATVSKELLFIMSHPCLGLSDKPSLQIQQGEAHKDVGRALMELPEGYLLPLGL